MLKRVFSLSLVLSFLTLPVQAKQIGDFNNVQDLLKAIRNSDIFLASDGIALPDTIIVKSESAEPGNILKLTTIACWGMERPSRPLRRYNPKVKLVSPLR